MIALVSHSKGDFFLIFKYKYNFFLACHVEGFPPRQPNPHLSFIKEHFQLLETTFYHALNWV
jgi:hypothetical protein